MRKREKTGNDTLGGELQNAVLPSFFVPPNKTRYLPGKKSGPTRKQKLDSTPIDVRVPPLTASGLIQTPQSEVPRDQCRVHSYYAFRGTSD